MRTPGAVPISRSHNPLMPGSWEPGRFQLADAILLKVTLIVMGLFRGADYLTPQVSGLTPVTETMQSAFPMDVWAALVLAPTFILAAGLAARIHFFVWLGHGLLAVVYLTLFVSMASVYVDRPLWDGIRSATVLLAPVMLHALITIRTGWRPPRWEE